MLDIIKQLKQLVIFWNLTRNSDSSFACDSELFFQCRDLSKFSGGILSCWVTIHWQPHRVLGKRSGSWKEFSSYKSVGRNVFGYPSGKKKLACSTHVTLVRKVVGCSRENVLRNICIVVFDIRIAWKRSWLDFLGMLMVWSCGLKKPRNDLDHCFCAFKSHELWGSVIFWTKFP